MSNPKLKRRVIVSALAALAVIGGLAYGWHTGLLQRLPAWGRHAVDEISGVEGSTPLPAQARIPFTLVPGQSDTLRFTPEVYQELQIVTVQVQAAPPPEPLRMAGSLVIDPNRLIRVHSRFAGEVVSIKTVLEPATGDGPRPTAARRALRYGDQVKKGDVLAIVWSKEIGEKKSELVDALSKLDADKKLLARLESVEEGVVTKKLLLEARRNVEADLVAVARAERTLRSWRLTDSELEVVLKEASDLREGRSDPTNDKRWAEVQILSPIDGVVVEKNFNEGAIVDPTDDLFQIADLTQLLVLANAYEEDLPSLRALPTDQRKWTVDHKADPYDKPIPGTFEVIGSLIDPQQHTGIVMGWVDNHEGRLASGQFITATVMLPPEAGLVAVPSTAIIEEGSSTSVFVETDRSLHEFKRRRVSVLHRSRNLVFIETAPEADGRRPGVEPLRPAEWVIARGVLELAAELETRKTAAAGQ